MKHQTISETATKQPLPQPSSPGSIDTATLELLASWRHQDATDNPEELRTAEQELSAFKKAMNENRTAQSTAKHPEILRKTAVLKAPVR